MAGGVVRILVIGAALVALWLLIAAVKRARRAGDFDQGTVLTLSMGLAATIPVIAAAFSGGVSRQPNVLGQLVKVYPSWYGTAGSLTKVMLAAIAVAFVVSRLRSERTTLQGAGLAAICLWITAELAAALHGDRPSAGGALLLVCLVAATLISRGSGACLGAGIFGVGIAIASGLLAALQYDVAFVVPCEGACSAPGFTGVMPNEDLLGITVAASLPFAYLGFRGPARFWLSAYLAGTAVATGSKTATIASLVTLVALLLVRPRVDEDRITPGREAVSWALFVAALGGSVYIVLHSWSPTALTLRPQVWTVAKTYIDQAPWLGYGPTRWASLYQLSEIPYADQRTSFNQWLDVLFAAGVVGTVFFVCLILATLSSAGRARAGILIALATIFMLGATEGVWPIAAFDLMSFSLVAVLLAGPATHRETADVGEGVRRRRRSPLFHDLPYTGVRRG